MSVEQQRQALIHDLHQAFVLTNDEAATLAEALKRGGPLPDVMHWEIMVGHPRLKSRHENLAGALRAHLQSFNVETRWTELMADHVRPKWRYMYYILRNGETYGRFVLTEEAI